MSASGIGKGRVAAETASAAELEGAPTASATTPSAEQLERFHALYRDHFDFVFRNLRRLGVPSAQVDDALQDVYMVVLRHLDQYREGTHSKAWLFAIALRVAGGYRRAQRRQDALAHRFSAHGEVLADRSGPSPFERAARTQAARFLHTFLDGLDEARRSVFILAELEQMSAPEIAEAIGVKLNTVYSRLRTARLELARAVADTRGEHDEAPTAAPPDGSGGSEGIDGAERDER